MLHWKSRNLSVTEVTICSLRLFSYVHLLSSKLFSSPSFPLVSFSKVSAFLCTLPSTDPNPPVSSGFLPSFRLLFSLRDTIPATIRRLHARGTACRGLQWRIISKRFATEGCVSLKNSVPENYLEILTVEVWVCWNLNFVIYLCDNLNISSGNSRWNHILAEYYRIIGVTDSALFKYLYFTV